MQFTFTIMWYIGMLRDLRKQRRISFISNRHCDVNRRSCSREVTQIAWSIFMLQPRKVLSNMLQKEAIFYNLFYNLNGWSLTRDWTPSWTHLSMHSFVRTGVQTKPGQYYPISLFWCERGKYEKSLVGLDFSGNVFACASNSFCTV